MIISSNWLKEFTAIDMPIEKLATLIGARLVEIEEVVDFGAKYKDVIIARVAECEVHPDSDHLSITKLDDGSVAQNVERDENGYVQVVCGAPNVRAGILVAWLPPGSVVPDTAETAEPFVLGSRKLRGIMSSGMIASPRELALFDEHDGILEVDAEVAPGTAFADAYDLNDFLLDIENKSLTHRPDTFGVVGFAREVAAIQGNAFSTPDWLKNTTPDFGEKQQTGILVPNVTIDDPTLSDRYQTVILGEVDGSAKTPLPLQTFLARVGVRPVSAIVDITNYVMLTTGQPLHAFDYDKLASVNNGEIDIHVRAGRSGETLELIDGRTIELDQSDVVIANGETAVALAGAMGGAATEIDDATKTILLESATFNLYNLRSTQMRHGIFSEAITRFTKGQPAELTAPVLANAVKLMKDYLGAVCLSDVVEAYPGYKAPVRLTLSIDKINAVLGTRLSVEQVVQSMQNVEFDVSKQQDKLTFRAPYWRGDIQIDEDIIEEVGRLNGFDSIEPRLPMRDFTAVLPSTFDTVRADVRRILTRAGANEVVTYSFVHGDVLTRAGQTVADSYRITNSISPELQYYRQTLTPSLLGAVHSNSKQGYDNFALFEINKVHPKQHGMTDEGVPAEVDMIALALAGQKRQDGAAYYGAKKLLDFLGKSLGLDFVYTPFDSDPNYPVTAPFEYRRSAQVTDRKTDIFIGIVGEYKKSVARGFKLPEYSSGFEIGSTALLEAIQKLTTSYQPLSRYPAAERDICFRVESGIRYAQIIEASEAALGETGLAFIISPVDIYQAEDDRSFKNITIRIKLTAPDKTLIGDEVATVIDTVIAAVSTATHATVV